MRNKGLFLLFFIAIIVFGYAFTVSKRPAESAKVKLGRTLFFDPILSLDSSISCASCHKPEFAFADTATITAGVHGRIGKRNAPSTMNVMARNSLFWDGRAASLETQALFPITDVNEMAMNMPDVVMRLKRNAKYRQMFYNVYKSAPTNQNIGDAIAAYEATLETDDSPYDRWFNGQENAMTEQQRRGRVVFLGKGQCRECHFTPDFTGDEFRNIGLFDGVKWKDSGRYNITKDVADIGKFKVPGLRNVALTAPYMHDGSFKTLRSVIEYYNNPDAVAPHAQGRDSLLAVPRHLTEQEMQDLEAFLHALTDSSFLSKK